MATLQYLANKGRVYLDDLKNVTVSGSSSVGTVIDIKVGNTVVLSHRYWADPSGNITLDLRDIVRARTIMLLPEGEPTGQEAAELSIVVIVDADGTGQTYSFTACGYRDGIRQRLSDIDYMRIPEDFRLFVTVPRATGNMAGINTTVKYIDHVGTTTLDSVSIEDAVGGNVSLEFYLPDIPYEKRRPFRLELKHQISGSAAMSTPIYEVCSGRFEQYAFMTEIGTVENIAMAGTMTRVPEYAFENAVHSSGMVKVRDDRQDVVSQDSGYLTEQAACTLARLLSSSDIYHLENGAWERILIVSPSVSVGTRASLHSVQFTWIHADKE